MANNNHKKQGLAPLMIGAIGVIYGDIGTSPLYAMKICFSIGGFPVNEGNVLGILSLFIWSLLLVVTLKYINIVMRVDDQGEGGILVLSSLSTKLKVIKKTAVPMVLGILGSALIFSDGIITPAISVLSAVEGLELISPLLSTHIILLSVLILGGLFYIQRSGSGSIGKFFGPIMIIWFSTLGFLGLYHIILEPTVLKAFSPYYAIAFFLENQWLALLTMGGVILVVTGAEAIYADLGHFGRKAIQYSWNFFVFPALILNYLGQGSLLLLSPEAIANPFYHLVPKIALYPMIVLATIATIIASQAIISGVYSLCWQAIMLNYLPRLNVRHTSSYQFGQIYLPAVNLILCSLTILAVLIFRRSENLGVAYGLAVAGCMIITTFLVFLVAARHWHWSYIKLCVLFIPLFVLDTTFLLTNLVKLIEGAWFTLFSAMCVCYIIRVWLRGNKALIDQKYIPHKDLKSFLTEYQMKHRTKIPGTAIFMTRYPDRVPSSLVIHLNHNKFLHKKMLFLSIIINDVPKINGKDRFNAHQLIKSAYVITANFGYMEDPNFHTIINWAKAENILGEEEDISFFFSKGVPVPSRRMDLSGFGEKLYIFLSKNSLSAYEFYKVPHYRVIELGVRYKI